jgi:hypothetical protein
MRSWKLRFPKLEVREAGASRTGFPSWSFTAIKLSVPWSAKPQLGVYQPLAKLGLDDPSMSVFAFKGSFGFLNLIA